MATTNIKRVVAEAIASYLAANITGLSGKISAAQEGVEKTQDFPSACLLSNVFSFQQFEPNEVYSPAFDDGKVIIDIGEFEGIYDLQLYAKNKPEREIYEQRILDFFLATQDAPGTLFVTTPNLVVNGYASLYSTEIKVRLNSEEWREEFSFESRRYSFLELEISFPALTTRDVFNIETLQVALSDYGSDIPVDIVTVLEDGTTELPT